MKIDTNKLKPVYQTSIVLVFTLSACVSTKEIEARQEQFNGKPLADVVAVIGNPDHKDADTAIWTFQEETVNFVPIYRSDQNGKTVVVGHNRQNVTLSCTYKATLKSGHIISGSYQGNKCDRFAPKIKN